jgi:hypothetical protein
MSNRRYIELYSANRNRNQYPLQSSFEVPFAPTRQCSNSQQAFDPIFSGSIYYKWYSGVGSNAISPAWPGATVPDPSSTPGCIYLSSISANLSSIINYYVGYQLLGGGNYRTIIAYDPINAKFTLSQPFPSVPVNVTLFDLSDGTGNLSPNPLPYVYPKIHIPSLDTNNNTVKFWTNAYDTCYIVDETKSDKNNIVYALITSYDHITQIATLDRRLEGFSVGNLLTIRKNLPQEKYTLTASPSVNNGTFVFFNGVIYNSSSLSSLTGTVNVPGMIVTLPPGEGNKQTNSYTGKYIYNTSNKGNPPYNGGGIYGTYFIKASYYNSSSSLVELLVDQSVIPLITCNYNPSIYLTQPREDFPDEKDEINIVNYIKDNYSPLNYNGTVVSQSETVCYEVCLVSLTLPNVSLRSGARAAFYPFFYVEFSNTTSPSGSSNDIIYSNSPNSSKALFIVPVTDTQQPLNSSFVKLYSNMTQTIKFKPNDSLKFSVYLPDGKLFETVEQDYLSPYAPNGIIQIDAVFGIKRI